MELTVNQKVAIKNAKAWFETQRKQVYVVAGFAGTGKTTLVEQMIEELGIKDNTKFATFTGKASLVLNQKGCTASTIHRLMYDLIEYFDPKEGKKKFKFEKKFELDPSIKLIVIDEISMVSEEILTDLLSYGIPVIALGDPKQLPPIGKDNGLLDNPDIFLTEIHRQAQDNPIIHLSMLAREGKQIPFGSFGKAVAVVRESDINDAVLKNATQIICGKNNTRRALNAKMRRLHGFEGDLPVVGDKVICLRNNWQEWLDGFPLINGMIGYVKGTGRFDGTAQTFEMDFRPEFLDEDVKFSKLVSDIKGFTQPDVMDLMDTKSNKFDFGYAITCHKSQGSGFDKVLLYEEMLNPENHSRWLYTGITRAENKLILVKREIKKRW